MKSLKAQGGVCKLGIPTVVDRTIQQAVVQLLSYLNAGYDWVVDIDLEKFFDSVPQDRLMSFVGCTIQDSDTESLIRKYLKAGVMDGGRYEPTEMVTPQGNTLKTRLFGLNY